MAWEMGMKNLLRRGVGLLTATIAMTGAAVAADMKAPVYKAPPPPVMADPWTGFYGGLNGGGAISRGRSGDTETSNSASLLPVIGADTFTHAPAGGVFGAQVGWNYHVAPSWLLGLEADAQWTNQQNDSACISACF